MYVQGDESSTDEKAASALNAVKLDDEVGGKAIQVRVVQGREPRHFIKMFGGKMVVFSGGKVISSTTVLPNVNSYALIFPFENFQYL